MTTRQTPYALADIAITPGTARLTAGENIAPFYDEESDMVVYNFASGPVPSAGSQASVHAKDRTYQYFNADTDTVVYRHDGHQATRRTAMMSAR